LRRSRLIRRERSSLGRVDVLTRSKLTEPSLSLGSRQTKRGGSGVRRHPDIESDLVFFCDAATDALGLS